MRISGNKRIALIEAAALYISEFGPERLSIAAAASLAGVNRTTAYYYFGDRNDLLKAVSVWASERVADFLMQHLPENAAVAPYQLTFDQPIASRLFVGAIMTRRDIREVMPQWDDYLASLSIDDLPQSTTALDREALGISILLISLVGLQLLAGLHASSPPGAITSSFQSITDRLLASS